MICYNAVKNMKAHLNILTHRMNVTNTTEDRHNLQCLLCWVQFHWLLNIQLMQMNYVLKRYWDHADSEYTGASL